VTCADDGDPCTANVCDPTRGGCVTDPIPGCCREDADCPDDGIFCARSVCDAATNRCVPDQLPDGTACDDGDPCTGPGACRAGECQPGAPLCGPCQVCTETGCAAGDDGVACSDGGACCGGDCLPPCQTPLVRAADCSCACPQSACAPGSEPDPATCACCRTVCTPDECGEIQDGCGGTLTCTAGCCERTTCQEAGATCGTIEDGCGLTLECGTCEEPLTCGGDGVPNRCGCVPGAVPGCCRVDADCDDGDHCTIDVCDPVSHTCVPDGSGSACGPDACCPAGEECCTVRNPDTGEEIEHRCIGCPEGQKLSGRCECGVACGFAVCPPDTTCCLSGNGLFTACCYEGSYCCSGTVASACCFEGQTCLTPPGGGAGCSSG
jgi:hypothetical protein